MDMSQGSNACQSHLGSGQESDEKKKQYYDHLKTFCCSAHMVQYGVNHDLDLCRKNAKGPFPIICSTSHFA